MSRLGFAWSACRQLQVVLVKCVDLLAQFLHIAVIHNDIIGCTQPRGTICLGPQDWGDLFLRDPVPADYASVLELDRRVYYQNAIQRVISSALDQQGDDNDAIRSVALIGQDNCLFANARVKDVFQFAAPCGVREYNASQCGTIEFAMLVQHRGAEA